MVHYRSVPDNAILGRVLFSLLSLAMFLRFLSTQQVQYLLAAMLLAGYAYWLWPAGLLFSSVILLYLLYLTL